MWVYQQAIGEMSRDLELPHYVGYSGSGVGKNDPSAEGQQGIGPIPRGVYDIGAPRDTAEHGPFVLPLSPVRGDLHGRSGFLIHGDSLEHPGEASRGCVILPRQAREAIWNSGDHVLVVLPS